MPDREKVIKGLECCEHLSGEYCRQCPYQEDIAAQTPQCCTGVLAHDAIALLKEQEPRVMSVEEVVGYVVLERDKTLWFEFRDSIKEINAKDIVYNDFICDEDCPRFNDPNFEWVDESKRDGVIIAEYNDTFRCWTSRPTDKQREETEWNESHEN